LLERADVLVTNQQEIQHAMGRLHTKMNLARMITPARMPRSKRPALFLLLLFLFLFCAIAEIHKREKRNEYGRHSWMWWVAAKAKVLTLLNKKNKKKATKGTHFHHTCVYFSHPSDNGEEKGGRTVCLFVTSCSWTFSHY
jgi:hypothetical protein